MLLFVSAVPLGVFRKGSINPRGSNGINHERGRDMDCQPAEPTPRSARASFQIFRVPSYAGSHRSNQSRSGTISLSDEPLRPCDSSSHLSGPRSDVPRRAQSISSRSEISRRSARSDVSPIAPLSPPSTSDELRVSQGRDDWSQVARKDSFQGQSLAIMPPPAPLQVSSSSYRPSESSHLRSSDRYEQQRLT
jgi:hypothetical protein